MKIYNNAEFDQLTTDEKEVNGGLFDRSPAADRRDGVLDALRRIQEHAPDGYTFGPETVANILGFNELFSRWISSEVAHGCSILGITRIRGSLRHARFKISA